MKIQLFENNFALGKFVIDFSCSLLQSPIQKEKWKMKNSEHYRNSRKEKRWQGKKTANHHSHHSKQNDSKKKKKMEIVKAQLVRDFQNTILHWHEANKTGKSRQNQIEYWALRKRDDFVRCSFASCWFSFEAILRTLLSSSLSSFLLMLSLRLFHLNTNLSDAISDIYEKKWKKCQWQILMGCVGFDAECWMHDAYGKFKLRTTHSKCKPKLWKWYKFRVSFGLVWSMYALCVCVSCLQSPT